MMTGEERRYIQLKALQEQLTKVKQKIRSDRHYQINRKERIDQIRVYQILNLDKKKEYRKEYYARTGKWVIVENVVTDGYTKKAIGVLYVYKRVNGNED